MSKKRVTVAFFDFTSCEGCQIELTNLGEQVFVGLLGHIEFVEFREAMSEKTGEPIDIAFIEGSFSREQDRERLEEIRARAKIVIAYGACATIGGGAADSQLPGLRGVQVPRDGLPVPVRRPLPGAHGPGRMRRALSRRRSSVRGVSGVRRPSEPGVVDQGPGREGRPSGGSSPDQVEALDFGISRPGVRAPMSKNISINVHHVTRIEGHGNIQVNVTDGKIEKCEWQVPEAPRFFEAMVRGRHYSEVARITSRICGICSVGHTLASIKATEHALGIQVTPQVKKLRQLLKHAENFDSHILHVLFLATPDLLAVPSVFPLVATHPDVVKLALRLKRFGHEWGSLIGGRTTHPTRPIPGGFGELPTTEELKKLRERFDTEALPDALKALEVFVSLAPKFPRFDRPTEYVALHSEEEYGLYLGDISCCMPDGKKEIVEVSDYRKVTNEHVVPQSTAKYTRHRLGSYMAGALARFNNNHDQLHPEARRVADKLALEPVVTNPYLNTAAQAVEVVHSAYESMRLLDELIDEGIEEEPLAKPTRHGQGAGGVEVPRGILFHDYVYDENHICQSGNCIIPTNQNHANIQLDMEKLVPEMLAASRSEKEMELQLEMLVRAYDPCVSCSTHYLDVTFVE
ncbi:MAG: nickel-dependent hydrogenase large subunit [Candidatus Riflebacteria bacterium]|nr:nickel-dependent hydrogenase large subunit [Candidatus Riflebacteria bacterium]